MVASVESLKKSAKQWLRELRAGDAAAHARFVAVHPRPPTHPSLRDVQLALAREQGYAGWRDLVAARTTDPDAAIAALIAAAAAGNAATVATVLDEHPAIIDARGALHGHSGLRTALHFAVGGEHEETVALLLARGANPNVRDEGDAATPLHFAAEKQHLGLVRALVDHGADPDGDGDVHGLGVLGWASAFSYVHARPELVAYLLAHGARHTIWSAVALGADDALRAVAAGSPGELARRMDLANLHRTPLHLAVVKRQPGAVVALLELGANPEAVDDRGLTPLDHAALADEHAIAGVLIDHGAAVRLPAAIALDRPRDLERLLRADPNALAPGQRWGQLICAAASLSTGQVIEALLRHGASVDVHEDPRTAIDSTAHFTPLHAAAFAGSTDAARALLARGADPTRREEKYAGTPAGWAARAGHRELRDMVLAGPIDLFEAIDHHAVARFSDIVARAPEALERPFAYYVTPQPRSNPWWPPAWATPLAWAVLRGDLAAVRALLVLGARPVRDPSGTPLVDHAATPEIRDVLRAYS